VRLTVNGGERGVSFKTSGTLQIDLAHPKRLFSQTGAPLTLSRVFMGVDGLQPEQSTINLDPADSSVTGILAHAPGEDLGVYIGFDTSSGAWQVLLSSPVRNPLNFFVHSSETITDVHSVGFEPFEPYLWNRLLVSRDTGFVDETEAAGLKRLDNCYSIAAEDFDNDMDLDAYIVCSGPITNLPNALYENRGDGTFVAVPSSGGAEGSGLGLGDKVATADYDGDGFVDLFVTNGRYVVPFFEEGPLQLFRNVGNDNHWIEIDLEGTHSNRDGIGARLFLTAGGVTQLREQGGGIHDHSQHSRRIHFGLGQNTVIDRLLILWPSGSVQSLRGIPVDQVLRVTESSRLDLPRPAGNSRSRRFGRSNR
jgi:hypothetical protein